MARPIQPEDWDGPNDPVPTLCQVTRGHLLFIDRALHQVGLPFTPNDGRRHRVFVLNGVVHANPHMHSYTDSQLRQITQARITSEMPICLWCWTGGALSTTLDGTRPDRRLRLWWSAGAKHKHVQPLLGALEQSADGATSALNAAERAAWHANALLEYILLLRTAYPNTVPHVKELVTVLFDDIARLHQHTRNTLNLPHVARDVQRAGGASELLQAGIVTDPQLIRLLAKLQDGTDTAPAGDLLESLIAETSKATLLVTRRLVAPPSDDDRYIRTGHTPYWHSSVASAVCFAGHMHNDGDYIYSLIPACWKGVVTSGGWTSLGEPTRDEIEHLTAGEIPEQVHVASQLAETAPQGDLPVRTVARHLI